MALREIYAVLKNKCLLKITSAVIPYTKADGTQTSVQEALDAQNSALKKNGKCAMFDNSDPYNIASSSVGVGTAWNREIMNTLGVEYVMDTINYKNGFRVPYSGAYRIVFTIYFSGTNWDDGINIIKGLLHRNGSLRAEQSKYTGNYNSVTFEFLDDANAGDIFTPLLSFNAGYSVQAQGAGSSFKIFYQG